MVSCAYCERDLICDACRAEFVPTSDEQYQALSRPEVAVACPSCGAVLVCHWCKTPYDGSTGDDETDGPAS
jgi:hypothetical protein